MFCFPEGVLRLRRMSGTPETSAVNAMVPLAKAERGRPEGAIITERVSTMSTYNRGEMCFTLERRQGRAGVERTPIEDMPCIGVVEGELELLRMVSQRS